MVDLVLVSLFGELEEGAKFPFALGPKNYLGGPVAKHYKDPGKRVILITGGHHYHFIRCILVSP